MYHQFKELAGVDITTQSMEVGPTCHYMMGGVRVDAETEQSTVPGLFAVGEVAGGMHGANRLGGNSLSDLLVFGRRAGMAAAEFASGRPSPATAERAEVAAVVADAEAPLGRVGGESPYELHSALQNMMQQLVGIIRTESELCQALEELDALDERAQKLSVSGGRAYNPGWNLATDLPAMLTVSRLVTKGALERRESRGGHTREDYPSPDPELGTVNLVQRIDAADEYTIAPEPLSEMPADLKELFVEEPH
jgi:succinate dehydrogenase / fumarate reductase flavoprotein subunit